MRFHPVFHLVFLPLFVIACGQTDESSSTDSTEANQTLDWKTLQDSTHRVAMATGFSGPEAVRYDAEQDVYFVANFNGGGTDRDANGFISRMTPDGTVESLEFMTGTEAFPLHAPRGMFIVGDTLWAADVDGLHGFHRQTGAHLAFRDFTAFEPGFLNDVAQGPDGAIYITDTGIPRLYRMLGDEVTMVLEDSLLGPPNGITWDAANERMIFAPWGGVQDFRAWRLGASTLEDVGTSPGGYFDGIEIVGTRILVASQADSSLYVLENGVGRPLIKVLGEPADIGIDTQRGHVAVPYIDLNRVDIWALPQQ